MVEVKRAVVRLEPIAHHLAAGGGEIEGKGRAGRRAAFEVEKAAVFPDNRIADREAQAGRRLLGREVRIENFIDQLRWHTRAMVRDRYLDVAPGFQWQPARLVDLHIFGADVDATAVRHRFPRVDDQSVDDLFDLANIDLSLAEVILNLDRGAQIRAME